MTIVRTKEKPIKELFFFSNPSGFSDRPQTGQHVCVLFMAYATDSQPPCGCVKKEQFTNNVSAALYKQW